MSVCVQKRKGGVNIKREKDRESEREPGRKKKREGDHLNHQVES